jgi:hypothetical protein
VAAGGLVIVMIGATGLTLATSAPAQAIVPLVVGLLSTSVAYGRWSSIGKAHPLLKVLKAPVGAQAVQ